MSLSMAGVKYYFSIIGQFWQEKSNGLIFRWNLLFIAVQILFLLFKFNDLPPQIPIFYSRPWGETQLGSAISIIILPTLSTFLLVINNFLAVSLLRSVPLLSRLLTIVSLLFSVFSAIAIYHIINLIA